MGRPRKYESQADRQRAYEERKTKEGLAPQGEPRPKRALTVEEETIEDAEEAYVARELAITRAFIATIPKTSPKAAPSAIEERLRRSEAYARWRFQSFLNGEVLSL